MPNYRNYFKSWQYLLLIQLISFMLTAQHNPPGLGFLGSGTLSIAQDISADGKVVVGTSDDGSSAGQQVFRWTEGTGMEAMGRLTSGLPSLGFATSDDGSVVVGISFYTSLYLEPIRITAENGVQGLGFLAGDNRTSGPIDVSADGSVIFGNSADTVIGTQVFRWTEGTGITALPHVSNGISSAMRAASANGLYTVGSSYDGSVEYLTRWDGNGNILLIDHLAGDNFGRAEDISDDGSVIVGRSSGSGTQQAFLWRQGSGTQSIAPAGSNNSTAFRVSGDGSIVLSFTNNPTEYYIWDDNLGNRKLLSALQDEYGYTVSGWSSFFPQDMVGENRKLKYLAGYGVNSDGKTEAWRIDLNQPAIQVLEPQTPLTYLPESSITVRWSANEVDSVAIYFSANATDSSATLSLVEASWPADAGQYSWTLPDTMSRKCIIVLEDVSNPAVSAVSDTFRIKPYILTKVDFWGDYEPFSIAQDAWQFDNRATNVWPQSWWQQFNYSLATDPNTGINYPADFVHFPLYARSRDFPDWPLLADAYGLLECYLNIPEAHYSPAALQFWKKIKGNWKGSCFGFSLTSMIAFGNRNEFYNLFPFINNFNDLRSLTAGDEERRAINQLFIGQFGERYQAHRRANWLQPPSQTVADLKAMFIADERDDRILLLYSNDPHDTGAHAVVPYKLEAHETLPDRYWIYVYDNNAPNDFTLRFLVNTAVDIWSYSRYPNWGGSSGLFLSNPMSDYYNDFNIEKAKTKGSLNNFKSSADGLIEISQSSGMNIEIRNTAGESVGYIDSTLVSNIADALPLIPVTGYSHPPTGFELTAGEYDITIDNFQDSSTYVSVVADSMIYQYSRNDAESNQQDRLSFTESFSIANPDAGNKRVDLQTILVEESRERVVDITNLAVGQGDSLSTNFAADGEYKLRNFGDDSSYDLRLELVSETENPVFIHNDIVLPPNSSHILQPDWDDLQNQPLQILIDEGNNGTIDDSITVVNQPTAIDEDEQQTAHLPQAFELAQNYPNPFNPETTIAFSLPKTAEIALTVYNVLGQPIVTLANGRYPAGNHSVKFDGEGLSSGVYLYRLETEGIVIVRKMLLIR